MFVDLSENQFTGALPVSVFQSSALQSFAAVSNCFDGAIPSDICQAVNLTTLALDGLMSARNCQQRGNGLVGSLSSNVLVGESLSDLSLSHNIFSGSIPDSIRDRKWMNLDLSFNRFGGTLSEATP
eukprot:gene38909-48047_t